MKLILTLLLLAMPLGATYAQQQASYPPNTIYGIVLDSITNKAIDGGDIAFTIPSIPSFTYTTDDSGFFCSIFRNYPESGEIAISKKGYITKHINIPTGAGNGNLGNILLIPGNDKPKKKKK